MLSLAQLLCNELGWYERKIGDLERSLSGLMPHCLPETQSQLRGNVTLASHELHSLLARCSRLHDHWTAKLREQTPPAAGARDHPRAGARSSRPAHV